MDDRGTPINNIPKIHNYDLDLHRLFKIVRMLGGYNKVIIPSFQLISFSLFYFRLQKMNNGVKYI